jgi:rare lipoprotein A
VLAASALLGCGTAPPAARPEARPVDGAAAARGDGGGGDSDGRAVAGQDGRADGRASYYSHRFDGRKTASGERYDPGLMTAAHRTLPFGTRLRVTRVGGPSVVVRVNDRCGCSGGRIIDLSQAAARKLDMLRAGTVPVRIEVIGR